MSKPYTKEEQKEKVFHFERRLKRECFGLKLTILNRDEKIFKFLWTENRILWNLGHLYYCLERIIKYEWIEGIHELFKSTTSKAIFMSINDPENFVDSL